jgi:Glycine zipper
MSGSADALQIRQSLMSNLRKEFRKQEERDAVNLQVSQQTLAFLRKITGNSDSGTGRKKGVFHDETMTKLYNLEVHQSASTNKWQKKFQSTLTNIYDILKKTEKGHSESSKGISGIVKFLRTTLGKILGVVTGVIAGVGGAAIRGVGGLARGAVDYGGRALRGGASFLGSPLGRAAGAAAGGYAVYNAYQGAKTDGGISAKGNLARLGEGAAGGAVTGAEFGSMFGPEGTAIGAAVGALGGAGVVLFKEYHSAIMKEVDKIKDYGSKVIANFVKGVGVISSDITSGYDTFVNDIMGFFKAAQSAVETQIAKIKKFADNMLHRFGLGGDSSKPPPVRSATGLAPHTKAPPPRHTTTTKPPATTDSTHHIISKIMTDTAKAATSAYHSISSTASSALSTASTDAINAYHETTSTASNAAATISKDTSEALKTAAQDLQDSTGKMKSLFTGIFSDPFMNFLMNTLSKTGTAAVGVGKAVIGGVEAGASATEKYVGNLLTPRGIRNNNPLNLSYVPGQVGLRTDTPSDGRFGVYQTMASGIAADAHQLQKYGQQGTNTLSSVVNKWAPPSENNVKAYMATVEKLTGFSANQKLNLNDPATLQKLIGAMSQMENGSAKGTLSNSDLTAGVKYALSSNYGSGPLPGMPNTTPQSPTQYARNEATPKVQKDPVKSTSSKTNNTQVASTKPPIGSKAASSMAPDIDATPIQISDSGLILVNSSHFA